MMKTEVNRLADPQVRAVTGTLTRAFRDDPVSRYLFPEDEKRARLLAWYLGSAVRYCQPYGEVYTTEGLDGVAAWLPPGKTRVSNPWHMLRSGMLSAPLRVRPSAFSRLITFGAYADAAHKRHAPGRHWYLLVLGVESSRQGRGVGGALLGPVLARADAEGLPCYLETQYERNVPFYEKHGFEMVEAGTIPGNGPRFWSMLRTPQR